MRSSAHLGCLITEVEILDELIGIVVGKIAVFLHILMAQPILVVNIGRGHVLRAFFLLLVKSGGGAIAALLESIFR